MVQYSGDQGKKDKMWGFAGLVGAKDYGRQRNQMRSKCIDVNVTAIVKAEYNILMNNATEY